jgi:hypothetical protein
MTKQIIVKLNQRRFKPILDKLGSDGLGSVKSYSELVGKVVFFDFLLEYEKCKKLDNKTCINFLTAGLGLTEEAFKKDFLRNYKEFSKSRRGRDSYKLLNLSKKWV